jgi:hypothetical protein
MRHREVELRGIIVSTRDAPSNELTLLLDPIDQTLAARTVALVFVCWRCSLAGVRLMVGLSPSSEVFNLANFISFRPSNTPIRGLLSAIEQNVGILLSEPHRQLLLATLR